MEIMTELTEAELEAVVGGAASATLTSTAEASGTTAIVNTMTLSTTPSSVRAHGDTEVSGTSSGSNAFTFSAASGSNAFTFSATVN
jgi:hypothetical protein